MGHLYEVAIDDVEALPDGEVAVAWGNAFIERIEAAGSWTQVWQKCGSTTSQDRSQPTPSNAFAQVSGTMPTTFVSSR